MDLTLFRLLFLPSLQCSVQAPENLPFTEHMLEFFEAVRDDVKGTKTVVSEQ